MGANCSVEGCKIKAMKHGRGLCYIHGENKIKKKEKEKLLCDSC
jgi:hypothetical protein